MCNMFCGTVYIKGHVTQVKYGDKVIDFGTELTPTEAHEIPEIHYKHEGGVLYTLVMTGKSWIV